MILLLSNIILLTCTADIKYSAPVGLSVCMRSDRKVRMRTIIIMMMSSRMRVADHHAS